MRPGAVDARDTVVVGGGAIGLGIAWELLRRGRRVALLERDRPGRAATWAAGGMLAPVAEAETEEPEVLELARRSLARYAVFVGELQRATGLDCGYRTEGTLWVAVRRDDLGELERLESILRAKELEAERLGAERVAALEPHLSGRVLGGLLLAGDHQVDPRRLVDGLARAVATLGGSIHAGTTVEAVEAKAGRVVAVRGRAADGGEFRRPCREVVLAAGAWSGGIELPCARPVVRPVKGQLVRLRGEPLLRRVIRTSEVYLVPRTDGELLIGASSEELGFDLRATAGPVMDLLRRAWELLPGCYDLELSEVSVGLRSALADHLPAIGPTQVEGLFLAFGHYRNGILLTPATAELLAETVVRGRVPSALEPFLPLRRQAATQRASERR